ncbi:hypothetical protein MJG53_003033 [Ovis ammon polii x Ovis aries]|uniref:Uncharacterized protein n=1 Tax=Ovis ammon polii x Ovis aries TaxID=2918886 RepID=A0ACB9VGM5_9CETA|nr:hypothetical protein MJT46_004381 [Ovis ammon polii x Ovis aries]KAI4588625.1 hypothetical protein MJG53_003033 [Ovis ammon polii x Ovis aries]
MPFRILEWELQTKLVKESNATLSVPPDSFVLWLPLDCTFWHPLEDPEVHMLDMNLELWLLQRFQSDHVSTEDLLLTPFAYHLRGALPPSSQLPTAILLSSVGRQKQLCTLAALAVPTAALRCTFMMVVVKTRDVVKVFVNILDVFQLSHCCLESSVPTRCHQPPVFYEPFKRDIRLLTVEKKLSLKEGDIYLCEYWILQITVSLNSLTKYLNRSRVD